MKPKTDKRLSVTIRLPTKTLWEGEAWAISSTNQLGAFDVLPEHTQYIGLIDEYVLIHQDNEDKRYTLTKALMRVVDNKVEIWLNE